MEAGPCVMKVWADQMDVKHVCCGTDDNKSDMNPKSESAVWKNRGPKTLLLIINGYVKQ